MSENGLPQLPQTNPVLQKQRLAAAAARHIRPPSIPKQEVILPEVTLASVSINPEIVNSEGILDFDLEAYIHTLGIARYPRKPKPLPLFWDCSYNCRVGNNKQRPPDFLFESPRLIKKFPEKLNDYSPSKIKSRSINHSFTYAHFRRRALEYPKLMDNIAYAETWTPDSLSNMVQQLDYFFNYLLGYLDHIIPYEYRAIHPAYLSYEQRKVKELTEEQRIYRNKEVVIILILIPFIPIYLFVMSVFFFIAGFSVLF